MSVAKVFTRLSTVEPPAHTRIVLGKAVVLGGSVAGLLAARVLADHAESVVIIERDEPGAAPVSRPGAPQDGQVHTLLPGGRAQLERFFPGFSDQAKAEGAMAATGDSARSYLDGRLLPPDYDIELLSSSRPFLETVIRRRVLELPNVKTMTARATGIEFQDGAVRAVRYAAGTDETGAEGVGTELADFVVDAMGRASKLGDWLADAGWERPALHRMITNVNYATAVFRRDADQPRIVTGISRCTPAAPANMSLGALNAVEDNRWMVMMAGYGADRPSRVPAEFLRRCRETLPPIFGEAVAGELLGEIQSYRQSDSRRRDYHRVQRLPAGLVSVGDAVASFNPVYGQGMSSAALHASCLSAYLCADPVVSEPARDFFAMQRVIVDAAWQTSTLSDLARPDIEGPYPRGYEFSRWLNGQISVAGQVDKEIRRRFSAVIYMLAHPSSLATPDTLLRALRANSRQR